MGEEGEEAGEEEPDDAGGEDAASEGWGPEERNGIPEGEGEGEPDEFVFEEFFAVFPDEGKMGDGEEDEVELGEGDFEV